MMSFFLAGVGLAAAALGITNDNEIVGAIQAVEAVGWFILSRLYARKIEQ